MVCALPDGNVYEIFSYNPATSNDATIMNQMLQRFPTFGEHFVSGDTFLFDRGFWDSVRTLEERGFNVFQPRFIQRGNTLYSAHNRTGKWIVEVRIHSDFGDRVTVYLFHRVIKFQRSVETTFGRVKSQFQLADTRYAMSTYQFFLIIWKSYAR